MIPSNFPGLPSYGSFSVPVPFWPSVRSAIQISNGYGSRSKALDNPITRHIWLLLFQRTKPRMPAATQSNIHVLGSGTGVKVKRVMSPAVENRPEESFARPATRETESPDQNAAFSA